MSQTKRQRFDSIMSRFDGEERRALADLHALGFRFRSIAGVRRYQARQYDKLKRSK